MNHHGGKLIYESCPAVCNVAGRPPLAIWVNPISCDGLQSPAEGAVVKAKRDTKGPSKPEQANKLTLHCDGKMIICCSLSCQI